MFAYVCVCPHVWMYVLSNEIFNKLIVSYFCLVCLYDRQKLLLTKFLGSGAFGEVYEGKARDIVTADVTTLVAVKVI